MNLLKAVKDADEQRRETWQPDATRKKTRKVFKGKQIQYVEEPTIKRG